MTQSDTAVDKLRETAARIMALYDRFWDTTRHAALQRVEWVETDPDPVMGDILFLPHQITEAVLKYGKRGESFVNNFAQMRFEEDTARNETQELLELHLNTPMLHERPIGDMSGLFALDSAGMVPWESFSLVISGKNNSPLFNPEGMVEQSWYYGDFLADLTTVATLSDKEFRSGAAKVAEIMLLWLGEYGVLQETADKLMHLYNTTMMPHHRMVRYAAQQLMVFHIAHAACNTLAKYELVTDTPWQWQEPLVVGDFMERLADTAIFQQLVSTTTVASKTVMNAELLAENGDV